jgi:SPP1 family phage portal protein
VGKMSSKTYGRVKILTDMTINGNIDNDKVIIPKIIEEALPYHSQNVGAYSINERWYFNDTEKILSKIKHIRPEIDNKFTFATAKSVVEMNNGYCFGEPFKYVTNEAEPYKQEQMTAFNKCLKLAQFHQHTRTCAENSAKFGIGYKLALRPTEKDIENGRFFRILSDIDNFNTFTVYSNTIEKEEVLGVIYYDRNVVDTKSKKKTKTERVFNCWTKYHQWTFVKDTKGNYSNLWFNVTINDTATELLAFPLKVSMEGVSRETLIPLQEFERTGDRVGDYELSIKLMDGINTLASCRLDSVQQSTDFIIKLRDIDLGEFDENGHNEVLERIQKYMAAHFLAVESRDGADVQPDIDVLDIPLNQSQVQELQDFLYSMLQEELQQPTRSGGTGQDTGVAVENRNGYRQFENLATKISDYMIYGEMKFVEKLLEIGKSYDKCPFKDLEIGDIEIKPMRNRSENKSTAVTNYREMRKAGVNPYTAYAESGLVADISDTIKMDEDWRKKEQAFLLENEVARQKALQKVKPKTEQSVEDNADGSDKTETVDEP